MMKMTKREYFDRLIQASVDGTFPSFKEEECGCYFQHPTIEGRRCAVGILFPKEMEIKNLKWNDDTVTGIPESVLQEYIPVGLTIRDLIEVQACHDDQRLKGTKWDAEKFKSRLKKLNCFKEYVND